MIHLCMDYNLYCKLSWSDHFILVYDIKGEGNCQLLRKLTMTQKFGKNFEQTNVMPGNPAPVWPIPIKVVHAGYGRAAIRR